MKYPIDRAFRKLKWVHFPKQLPLLAIENRVIHGLYRLQPVKKSINYQQVLIPTRDQKQIKMDLFSPKERKPKGFMLYLPGGGFVMEASHYHKKNIMDFAEETDLVIGLLHYRLAPKYPYPKAIEDVLDAIHYIKTEASYQTWVTDGIIIGGDSAGGNLAMGSALYERDHASLKIAAIMLIYPGLIDGFSTESRKQYTDVPMFNASILPYLDRWVYPQGVGDWKPYAFPYHHPQLNHLPPVYIETAEFDCLHDEGIAFYHLLKELGNSVTLHETKGTVHGYDIVKKAKQTIESRQKRIDFLVSIFKNSF